MHVKKELKNQVKSKDKSPKKTVIEVRKSRKVSEGSTNSGFVRGHGG